MPDIDKKASQGALIVTGAGRGIGAAVARLAGARGFSVAVNYALDAQSAAEVVRHIASSGGRAIAIQADISREDEILKLFQNAERELGPLTGLVNNAGITGGFARVLTMSRWNCRQYRQMAAQGPAEFTQRVEGQGLREVRQVAPAAFGVAQVPAVQHGARVVERIEAGSQLVEEHNVAAHSPFPSGPEMQSNRGLRGEQPANQKVGSGRRRCPMPVSPEFDKTVGRAVHYNATLPRAPWWRSSARS